MHEEKWQIEEMVVPRNAREMGFEATVESLRHLLVDQFQVASAPESINTQDSLFSAGVGLSSLEGMKLLAVLEKKYGLVIDDLEYWLDEDPTLDGVARYLVANTPARKASSTS